jgi:uncharacterized FlaG/YvyC family protein
MKYNYNYEAEYKTEEWYQQAGTRSRERMEKSSQQLARLYKILNRDTEIELTQDEQDMNRKKVLREIEHYEQHIKQIKQHHGHVIDQLANMPNLMMAFIKGINTNKSNA